MNKLQMAHEYFMKHGRNNSWMESDVIDAWKYADEMQAEADKRVVKLPDVFFDTNKNEEWQPDWSQAPEWADWWAIDKDLVSFWHEDKPKFDEVEFYQCGVFCDAPSFNYQGNWQDSLRKRPQ